VSEEKKRMAIIVHSGTMDKLYPAFMEIALRADVHLFI